MNDTYYDHAKQSQQNALDDETRAYDDTMSRFIIGLRTSLEDATKNMDAFLMSVTTMVMYNADTVLEKYQETNLPLTTELTNPWIKAKEAAGDYSGNALDLMNQWTKADGFFAQFNTIGTTNLTSPWAQGINAAEGFKVDVSDVMSQVVSNIATNVDAAGAELSSLYSQIKDTEAGLSNISQSVNNVVSDISYQVGQASSELSELTQRVQTTKNQVSEVTGQATNAGDKWAAAGPPVKVADAGFTTETAYVYLETSIGQFSASGTGAKPIDAYISAKDNVIQAAYNAHKKKGYSDLVLEKLVKAWKKNVTSAKPKSTSNTRQNLMYAKGTTGTTRDQWAITDEPQFGDELTMYATPEGTLSFMRAGSTVIPADLTRELIDLPKVVDGLIHRPKFDSGINMIASAINKPEIVIDVENFLKVDRVDKDTLPQLEAMMDKKIDTFARQLNYSIKKFSR